jgi:NitT/TauT family transport system substrate-binding protein
MPQRYLLPSSLSAANRFVRSLLLGGLAVLLLLAACSPASSSPVPAAPAAPAAPPSSASGAPAAAPAAPPREKVVVAYSQRSVSQGMHIFAMESGYFDQQGLDIELTQIPGSTVLTAALIAGEAQFGTVGASAPTEARLGGADLVMIADTAPVLVFWVISRPEFRSVADLKGKRIGITRIGTATHFAGRVALRHHGLDPETDAAWLNMSTLSAIVAGLEAGALDGGIATPVEKLAATKLGMNALFDVGTISPPFSQAGIVTSGALTRSRPDLMLRFLRGHLDGLKRVRSDEPWGKAVMARWLQVDDAELIDDSYATYVTRHLPEIPVPRTESVQPIIDLLALSEPRAAQLRAEEVIAPQFIRQLEAEGFFQQPPGR